MTFGHDIMRNELYFEMLYFARETSPPKAEEKLQEELKQHLIQKRSFLSLHDFPTFYNLDLTNTDLERRLAILAMGILGKKNKTTTEQSISPILPFPRVG